MVFQIQFSLPSGKISAACDFFFQTGKKIMSKGDLRAWQAGNPPTHPSLIFQHLCSRTATAVSVTEAAKHFLIQILIRISLPGSLHLCRNQIGIVSRIMLRLRPVFFRRLVIFPGRNEVGQRSGAIQSFPEEGITGHLVRFVPADLGCHEITDPAQLHDLRQGGRIAEHIREPEDFIVLAEFLSEKAFAVQELSGQTFTGSEVAVGFHPHAPFHFPATFLHTLFDFFINLRRIFFDIDVQLRLRGHETVLRVALHQLYDGGKRTDRLVFRHAQGPKPGTVDMRVSDAADDRLLVGIAVFFIEVFGDKLLRFFQ